MVPSEDPDPTAPRAERRRLPGATAPPGGGDGASGSDGTAWRKGKSFVDVDDPALEVAALRVDPKVDEKTAARHDRERDAFRRKFSEPGADLESTTRDDFLTDVRRRINRTDLAAQSVNPIFVSWFEIFRSHLSLFFQVLLRNRPGRND
jgi:hypothetical protein